MTRILVVYATWTGATREVAEAIANTLRSGDANTAVEVLPAGKAAQLDGYDAVVVGTSVHAGRLPREMLGFVKKHRQALGRIPVAQFVVCLTMTQDTPENRLTATGYLDPLRQAAPEMSPVDTGLFAGAVLSETPEFRRLNPFVKFIAGSMAKNQSDHRDWDAIRVWAEGLRPKLLPATPA